MNVLVIGSGGREHAMAWKLAQSDKVQVVYVAPGNGAMGSSGRIRRLPITDILELRHWVQTNKIGLTVVGPEAPLAAGIVDAFRQSGLRIFGPTRAAAQLESSKAFSKAFMQRHGIPTAAFEVFTEAAAAKAYVQNVGVPIVIKADGLAAGKGVVVATSLEQAYAAVDFMLQVKGAGVTHNAGDDGQAVPRVVIEEFLQGEEASFIVMCDGKEVVPLAPSQDHKRLQDGDMGPNTGGMGAYSPAPVVTPQVHARAMREIILPTLKAMEQEGNPYTGFLYAGLMVTPAGQVKTLEFNCRMGDPETQPVLMRLKSDFYDVLMAATELGGLEHVELDWDRRAALGVVLVAHGYPADPRKGDAITGLPVDGDNSMVFHAGTEHSNGALRTSGGRVLCVTALGDSVRAARLLAYETLSGIRFDGMQYRTDIGHRAVVRS
ncbi:MAG: phosphoribosylamine--glycine ligase [Rhodoferax sp.]|nr:phosphoribosylamine--glycine ligase [Rhodoferax sp.]